MPEHEVEGVVLETAASEASHAAVSTSGTQSGALRFQHLQHAGEISEQVAAPITPSCIR